MRKYGRIDANQKSIVKELREIPGFSVSVTAALGNGAQDLLVGYEGFNGCYEVKDPNKAPSRRKLTDDEKKFHEKWTGHLKVVETTTEIVRDMRLQAHKLKARL